MGAFIGNDTEVSWEIVRRYGEISWPKGGAMLGCSRKGFLRIPGERDSSDRDGVSALCGVIAASKLAADIPLYLRVHNVVMQRAAVEAWMRTLS
jgi:dihydropteroate synthase